MSKGSRKSNGAKDVMQKLKGNFSLQKELEAQGG